MFRRKWLTAGLALALGGGVAVAVPGLTAVGQSSPPSSPVILQTTATVVNKGAAALPTVLVACQPGDFAFLSVTLSEKSGSGIAAGTSPPTQVACNGEIETFVIPVTPTTKPFVKGTALGQATLTDCPFQCVTSTDTENVRLTTK
jgi:hypothetical protein